MTETTESKFNFTNLFTGRGMMEFELAKIGLRWRTQDTALPSGEVHSVFGLPVEEVPTPEGRARLQAYLKAHPEIQVTEHSSKTGISQPETDLVKAKREES